MSWKPIKVAKIQKSFRWINQLDLFSIEQSIKEAQFNLNLENRIAKNDKYLLIQQQIKLTDTNKAKSSRWT